MGPSSTLRVRAQGPWLAIFEMLRIVGLTLTSSGSSDRGRRDVSKSPCLIWISTKEDDLCHSFSLGKLFLVLPATIGQLGEILVAWFDWLI